MGCQTKDEDDEDDDFGVKNDGDDLSRSLPLITRQKPRRECLFHILVYNLDDDDNDGHFIEADTYLYYNYNYYYQ